MDLILAGKYESAIVRMVDAETNPTRNATLNGYYMDLNRKVDKRFTDGAGTFVSIASETFIPGELDWNFGSRPDHLSTALSMKKANYDFRDEPHSNQRKLITELLENIVRNKILSLSSVDYITGLDLSHYSDDDIKNIKKSPKFRRSILTAYLLRLLTQVYASNEVKSHLLIGEQDIRVLSEIADAIARRALNTLLPFPDLRGKLLNPDLFANGILNFSPEDLGSVVAVRSDADVRKYAEVINKELEKHPNDVQNDMLNEALIEAYQKSKAGHKAKKIFEIATWVVKPLHYIPGAGEVMTIAEDIKDAALALAESRTAYQDWYMIGVRMQEVKVKDYMKRISNKYPSARV